MIDQRTTLFTSRHTDFDARMRDIGHEFGHKFVSKWYAGTDDWKYRGGETVSR